MNFELARFNMVEQQVRTWEVLDSKVLDLLEAAPRHEYVPRAYTQLAYADIAIPLEGGQEMLTPRVEARLLQALELRQTDKILEVGSGTGFLTSLLATLGGSVTSVEISSSLARLAEQNLRDHDMRGIDLVAADALQGWPSAAPYDVIAVTGSVSTLGQAFQQQLKIGGRLFIVTGEAPAMEALLIRRTGQQQWTNESLFETVLPPLTGAEPPPKFVF